MAEQLTILESYGRRLTKLYCLDGTTTPYGEALSFKTTTVSVASLKGVAALLGKLHGNPHRCLIRGKLVDAPQPGGVEGSVARNNANFDDQPLHTFMIDIDGFEPFAADPVREPAEAVRELMIEVLPACFLDASFYWHLSSSAGMPGKESKLKCHVWMWSKTPYTTAQMRAWAKRIGTMIDSAVYQRIQIHYTANPLFEEGRRDPVEVRAGWHQGETDEVDLVISEDVLAAAREAGAGTGGSDMKLKDPSEKAGTIGLFHRTFDADDVLLTLLDEFEQVSQRRYTWLNGGGTPEGVWVHDDGMHVGSSHNTWPLDGVANLWDVVREFKFGDLDKAASEDDFDQLVAAERQVGQRPSDKAMLAWAEDLPEIKEALAQEADAHFLALKAQIDQCPTVRALERDIAPSVANEKVSDSDRVRLVAAVQARYKTLAGVSLPISMARSWLTPQREAEEAVATWSHEPPPMSEETPAWAQDWVWVADLDSFMHRVLKTAESTLSYNARFNRFMAAYADGEGRTPEAAKYSLTVWRTQVFDTAEYNPGARWCYRRDGIHCFNVYRADLLPIEPKVFSDRDRQAIQAIEEHLSLLLPNERERELLTDWLAFCVQYPGKKIRWTPLLVGTPGDGKTALIELAGKVLGPGNAKTVNNKTLESPFNGWAASSHFVGIEELKMNGHSRYDVFNGIKDIITNNRIEIHAKGRDPFNVPNYINMLLLSNHKDAAPLENNDRRLYCLFTPYAGHSNAEALTKGIMAKTGLSREQYFHRLFNETIHNENVTGALRKWLRERALSAEFDADDRAPETAARGVVMALSRSDVEDGVDKVLADGGLGIYPTLVSSKHLLDTVCARNPGLGRPQGRSVRNLLASRGWEPFHQDSVRWTMGGGVCTWYYKGEEPMHPNLLADGYEKERQANAIEESFGD